MKNTHIKQRGGGGYNLNVEKDLNVAKIRQIASLIKTNFHRLGYDLKTPNSKPFFSTFSPHTLP